MLLLLLACSIPFVFGYSSALVGFHSSQQSCLPSDTISAKMYESELNDPNSPKKYIKMNKTYSKARIYQTGKSPLEVRDLILLNDTLIQYRKASSRQNEIVRMPAGTIRSISALQGTHAGLGAFSGGLICLVSGLSTFAEVESDPYMGNLGISWGPIILGLTAGGVLTGALVGALFPKWRNLYIPANSGQLSLEFNPVLGKDYCGLGIALRF